MDEEGRTEPARGVVVRYCGGCNPHIDRTAVVAGLPLEDPDIREGATVHVSGCPRACASDHLLSARQGRTGEPGAQDPTHASDDPVIVIVAGELVDGIPTPAAELAPTVTRKLKE